MTADERAALKARLLARTQKRISEAEARPGFAEEYAAWEREYRATVALYKARQKANLTQAELAKRSGVSLRSIQMYEQRNKDINKASSETLYRISKVLGCTIEDLLEK